MSFIRSARRGDKGFTLVEIMIVLAVLAVLAAVVIPNVAGFLGRGKERAFSRDRDILQAAVDAWRTDVGSRSGNPWPTIGSSGAGAIAACTDVATDGIDVNDVAAGCSIIKVSNLATTYLKATDAVKSFAYTGTAPTPTTIGATNSPKGSYIWYIDASGLVQARRWTDTNTDNIVNAGAELAGSDGFATDVYP
ncbi:MAG: prepilin-type N-terminal cleavage/methylation domain-containing protein [Chloroflexi bacterium]|nr:prepilin-type N-terminal cleavage/methylation domain-containing protein [Chloroflexota bacterium]